MHGQIEAVLECCKHYDAILNFPYSHQDYISEKLITAYQEYLFQVDCNDAKAVHMAVQLDQVMYVYISTKNFYRYVQSYYLEDTSVSFGDIIDVIALYHDYVKKEIQTTQTTKWI